MDFLIITAKVNDFKEYLLEICLLFVLNAYAT